MYYILYLMIKIFQSIKALPFCVASHNIWFGLHIGLYLTNMLLRGQGPIIPELLSQLEILTRPKWDSSYKPPLVLSQKDY